MRKHIEKDYGRCMEHTHCIRCGKQLDEPEKVVWLEWDTGIGGPGVQGKIAPEDSQGCFPYGRDCAAALGFRNDSETLK